LTCCRFAIRLGGIFFGGEMMRRFVRNGFWLGWLLSLLRIESIGQPQAPASAKE